MSGFGSNACCPGPDLRFWGIALSDKSSMKSFTIKSLLENASNPKLGPRGNMERPGVTWPVIEFAITSRCAVGIGEFGVSRRKCLQ